MVVPCQQGSGDLRSDAAGPGRGGSGPGNNLDVPHGPTSADWQQAYMSAVLLSALIPSTPIPLDDQVTWHGSGPSSSTTTALLSPELATYGVIQMLDAMALVLTSPMVPPHVHEQVEAPGELLQRADGRGLLHRHPRRRRSGARPARRGQHRKLAASACAALSVHHFFTKHNKLNKLTV